MKLIKQEEHSITSQDFKMWMMAVDDDETEIEDLYQEYLAEIKANKHETNQRNQIENR